MRKHRGYNRKHEYAERRKRVLQLRLGGATYAQIAEAVESDPTTVYRDLKKEFERLAAENREHTEQLRAQEIARLERLHMAVWPRAIGSNGGQPDMKAVREVIRLSEHRCRILGLFEQPPAQDGSPQGGGGASVNINIANLSVAQLEQLDSILAQLEDAGGASTETPLLEGTAIPVE